MTASTDIANLLIINEGLTKTKNAVCIIDRNYTITFCNKVMAALFGLPLQQIIGQSQEDILHEAYSRNKGINIGSDSVHDWLKEIKKNQRNLQENEFVLSFTDGDVFKLYRVKVSSGKHIVIGTKITELIETQKQLKGTLKKLDELAKTCELTGLPNRRHILNVLKKSSIEPKDTVQSLQ